MSCCRFRFGTSPSEIAYAYIWFGYGMKSNHYTPGLISRVGIAQSTLIYSLFCLLLLLFFITIGLMMCVLITACNVGVIGALFKMKRRSESRSLKNRKFNCFDRSKGKNQEESIGLRNDTAGISVDRSNSTMTTNSRPSFRKREGSLAQNNAKEEVKFAILMVIIIPTLKYNYMSRPK